MDSEEHIIIAFVYKRSGKQELTASDIYLPLSLELGWFTSQQAQHFVQHAINKKLLVQKKNLLTPTFDINTVTIPIGFRPSAQIYETKKTKNDENLQEKIIEYIREKTGQTKKNISMKIQEKQEEKKINPEVAALLVARELNVDVKDFFDDVEKKLLMKRSDE